MQKDEINILIVDDDATIGKALKEAFTRAGFKATHVTKPVDALTFMKLQSVHAAIIDCMLPKMNGRQLAKKMKDESSKDLPIVLMSGIYKDKSFARDALQETGAMSFFTKPFDVEELTRTIESKLESLSLIDTPLMPLQALMTKDTLTHKERMKAVNDASEVHGFDLPWIFSALMHPRINGHLNIVSADGEVCGVGFWKGNIVQVNQKDAKSYFGVLMVEYGFITQAEIEEVMKATGRTKKMGERLVEANMLSPHAIQIVMAEQQGLRLSKTISETTVKVNFIDSDEMREDALLDRIALTDLMNEWLNSKLTGAWLKSSYMPWLKYNVKRTPEFDKNHRVHLIPAVQRCPGVVDLLLRATNLEVALVELQGSHEDHFYPALHALITSRQLRFGEITSINVDSGSQKKRLEKLYIDLEKRNYFERLGITPSSKDADIKRAYHELAKILHPDKLNPETPNEVRDLAKKCFSLVTTAHETLSDVKKKSQYMLEMEKGRAESILEAERLTQFARTLLTKGDFRKAKETMLDAVALCPPTSEARLLLMWARLKTVGLENNLKMVDEIRGEIASIPPEDRHNPIFYFVKGLQLRLANDEEGARRSLAHAVSIAPDFIDAKREMSLLNAQANADKPVDLLKGDLKDVVGMLFKKKK
ncbi:MAG: response regulator [Bdellovibrionota bacterium]